MQFSLFFLYLLHLFEKEYIKNLPKEYSTRNLVYQDINWKTTKSQRPKHKFYFSSSIADFNASSIPQPYLKSGSI